MSSEFQKYLARLDSYWLEGIYESTKLKLTKEENKLYKDNGIKITKATKDSICKFLEQSLKLNKISIQEIKNLCIEKIENNRKRIKLYKLDQNVLNSITSSELLLNQLLSNPETSKDKNWENVYVINQNSECALIYTDKTENEYKLVYRYRVSFKTVIDGREQIDFKVIPVILAIDLKTNFARIMIECSTDVKYKSVFSYFERKLENLLSLKPKTLTSYYLLDSISDLFKDDLLIKFEGWHLLGQEYDGNSCEVKIKFTIEDKAGIIDYTRLPVFLLFGENYGVIEKISGFWNIEKADVNTFINKDRSITFNTKTNEIILNSDYREQEVNYALSCIR